MSRARALAAAHVHDAAPLFAALGDETRLRLLGRLSSHGPESITGLCERSEITRQAITKHLQVLSKAGLVRDRWTGRERIWELEASRLAEARTHLERISALWDDSLERLKGFVER
jgi:DNA-binding transcriptional ArsR family regulator